MRVPTTPAAPSRDTVRAPRLLPLLSTALACFLAAAGCDDDGDTVKNVTVVPAEGVQLQVDSARIGSDRRPIVDFTLTDGVGQPLEISDLDAPPSFVYGWIEEDPETGLSRYRSHIVRDVAGAKYEDGGSMVDPVLASAPQVGTDRGGTFVKRGPGSHRYTFAAALPADYDRGTTHTVGAYATRTERAHVSNAVHSFVPGGGVPQVLREVAATEACNACHDTLEAHDGTSREVGLCVICHSDQTVDPETGNTVEFEVMIHKIHAGETLTQQPYRIVGLRQSINDYSEVVFPRELRGCTACHRDAAQADHWKSRPSRAACGSCHDDVNFQTGEGHSGGIQQLDDTLCSRCHRDTIVAEFDNTVPGAHTIPYESMVNPNLTLAITGVENMKAGVKPSVRFAITDRSGPVEIATLNRVAIVFSGPTPDYSQPPVGNIFVIQGNNATPGLTTNGPGDYTYAPGPFEIPDDATGTWSVGLEARTNQLPAGEGTARFGANNPIAHIDLAAGTLGGGSPASRRTVVSEESCNVCHGDLRFHGDLGTEIPYCLLCHNRLATDEAVRPDVDPTTNPPATIDFEVLLHRIHRGEDLTEPYTVYGLGGTPIDFTKVRFPGDLRNCSNCHVDDSHLLPLPEATGATVIRVGGTQIPGDRAVFPPITAACTGCHDDDSALAHARLNTVFVDASNFSEACVVCHGEGSLEAVSVVHSTESAE